ncbi:WhiB family transcriptional regulator [Streptomyces sp. NBC_01506]|uniref:WhiB family transcriptional regulator n=1 Tax=Streptomyces sp. NBC_01506 TaxID=2903887 RepID=UPI003865AB58
MSPDWRAEALCAETDPEIFYPERGDSVTAALEICMGCPVRRACADYAIEHEAEGVWGGLSAKQRRAIRSTSGTRLNTPARKAS